MNKACFFHIIPRYGWYLWNYTPKGLHPISTHSTVWDGSLSLYTVSSKWKFGTYHAGRSLIEEERLILDLLESTAKVSACSQAMIYGEYGFYVIGTKMTGIHLAAYVGLSRSMTDLLERSHDVDPKDDNGQTPLSYAAENGCEAVVKLLLDKDANIESKDNDGRTPLSYAAEGHVAIIKLFRLPRFSQISPSSTMQVEEH